MRAEQDLASQILTPNPVPLAADFEPPVPHSPSSPARQYHGLQLQGYLSEWRPAGCASHFLVFFTLSQLPFFLFLTPHAFGPRARQYDVAQLQDPSARMAAC
jgi:hypothetical protein